MLVVYRNYNVLFVDLIFFAQVFFVGKAAANEYFCTRLLV